MAPRGELRGGLVVSLDFELIWGVRDHVASSGGYRLQLRGALEAVPRILDLFSEFGVAATWATVGALFAESREEFLAFLPSELPTYSDETLSPYADLSTIGLNEADLDFAPSLVREIAARPGQELASHTFSHYLCLEPGQTRSQFEADVASAVAIAAAHGYVLTSMVFPRNQVNESYLPILEHHGFTAYRGTEDHLIGKPHAGSGDTMLVRGMRLADAIVSISGPGSVPWSATQSVGGLSNVRASRFLRPLRHRPFVHHLFVRRVERGMLHAARNDELYHLWWHPHNFGTELSENLGALRRILMGFERLRDTYGFESYSMREVAAVSARPSRTEAIPRLDAAGQRHAPDGRAS